MPPPDDACIAEFFDTRIFGPDRAALPAAALPTEAAALHQRLRQIDAAENAHAR